ncbi:MAG: hypothetical protein ISQ14_01075 [Verrucomicrobiae bacterium]|jgi:uncharacterized membrane protein|nr:hypothetical protein [Verrucomicrobiae bacterium]
MPVPAEIVWSGRDWMMPVLILGAVGLVALAFSYRGTPGRPGTRALCVFLRVIGVAALVLCVLEPQWSTQRAKPGANLFAVLADNSQGMGIHDLGDPESRGDRLRKLLDGGKAAWINTLREDFKLRSYAFDSKIRSTDDFTDLDFKGRATSLATALTTVRDRYEGRPLAGIIVLTDGNATDVAAEGLDVGKLPPVYPVVIGRDDAGRDISIQKVTVTQTAFEDAPVTIESRVDISGFQNRKVMALLFDDAGKEVGRREMTSADAADSASFRFEVRPSKAGVTYYRLRVGTPGWLEKEAKSDEATEANNHRVIAVDRGQGPYRVLYVGGRPNWEFKFLNRAVVGDDQTDLVGLIRIARREPKFVFRGRAGESSNPLFRGFGNQSEEEVQRYDQPVLIRVNTKDGEELAGGFPRTEEELYGFSAIILDDIEADFFTADQKSLVRDFVSRRGGGFMMLGGIDAFQDGNYDKTPIADLMPFYVDGAPTEPGFDDLKFDLTREGFLQSWVRLRQTESEEKGRVAMMPHFEIMNPLPKVKPGAGVVATVTDQFGDQRPALAVQRFGYGRTAALTLGDFWRWAMADPELHADFAKAWRQMLRWLVADVPRRVELKSEPVAGDPNQAMRLTVKARDPKFNALDNATVELKVFPIGEDGKPGKAIRLPAEPSDTESGIYTSVYVPRGTGGFLAQTTVTNAAGLEIGSDQTGWTTDLAAEEFRSLQPNRPLLDQLARRTGGQVVQADALASFVGGLPNLQSPVMEAWTQPLWHTPLVFAFALACFVAEWGLRRWRGMP